MPQSQSLILENATKLRALYDDLKSAWKEAPQGPRHHAAATAFHERYDLLAFPGGLAAGLAALRAGDASAVELSIRFLEADPLFHYSGYIKERLIGPLKRTSLNSSQSHRIRLVILRSLASWRMPQKILLLAPRVDSAAFRNDLEAALQTSQVRIQLRARKTLQILKSAGLG